MPASRRVFAQVERLKTLEAAERTEATERTELGESLEAPERLGRAIFLCRVCRLVSSAAFCVCFQMRA